MLLEILTIELIYLVEEDDVMKYCELFMFMNINILIIHYRNLRLILCNIVKGIQINLSMVL